MDGTNLLIKLSAMLVDERDCTNRLKAENGTLVATYNKCQKEKEGVQAALVESQRELEQAHSLRKNLVALKKQESAPCSTACGPRAGKKTKTRKNL